MSGLLTPILTLIYPWANKTSQLAKAVEAMDRTIAAFYFGCSGRWTLSIECAHQKRQDMKALRQLMNQVSPGHCEESAFTENAHCDYPRKK